MDSFYDVKGNEVSKDGIVTEFISNYTGIVTDFTEGSEIRNLLEAFAVYAMGLEERLNDVLYVVDVLNADGEYLDLFASQPHIDMERITGVEATGYVTFTIKTALTEELLIPAGTVVTSNTGLDFETVTDNFILPGELSRDCMVQAIDVGVDGNIPANSILTKIDGYDAVDGFTLSNPNPFMGGLDYEEDEEFRQRIITRMSLQKFGSKPYYIACLMNEFPSAHDIKFDASVGVVTAQVIANCYDGSTAQSELNLDIAGYLNDDNNILLGHSFGVISPTPKTINIYFQNTVGSSTGIYIKLASYTTEVVNNAKEVIDTYLKGGSLSFNVLDFRGLNLDEEWNMVDLQNALQTAMPDDFVTINEYGDAHTLGDSYDKYEWSYHV